MTGKGSGNGFDSDLRPCWKNPNKLEEQNNTQQEINHINDQALNDSQTWKRVAVGASGGEGGRLWDDIKICLHRNAENNQAAVTRRRSLFFPPLSHLHVVIQVNSHQNLVSRSSSLLLISWQKGKNMLTRKRSKCSCGAVLLIKKRSFYSPAAWKINKGNSPFIDE